ncbi:MAG: CocE/NonD family hydrolase [Nostocaceae cyanobacterium]|nr:CocE/NonD family hydrolase [Nostocaceae cyanobacterium]
MHKLLPKQTASMFTRDGVRLDADIYRPDAEGEFPVLLMRQPYGREIASTVVYAHPSWYAAQGYIVVIQDVRGRGTSQGEFQVFVNEIADGEDTINWAATLSCSNGNVGMYGFSYQGMTQLYAAAAKPPALKTICPAMVGYDLYTDWAYEGGAFCLQSNLSWALQLYAENARLRQDEATYHALLAAAQNLPLWDSFPARPEILTNLAPNSFYHDWLSHSQPDEYWQKLSPQGYLQDVDLPMFHIGGWFDTFLRGTMGFYQDMAQRSLNRQQLLVGPWTHIPWGRKAGAVDFGASASSPVDEMQIQWFDYFLKGIDNGLSDQPSIYLFEMGGDRWTDFANVKELEQKTYFLSSTGLASIREDAGSLIEHLHSQIPDAVDVIVHDPWRPVPSLGGHVAIPAGSFERSSIDCRSDVLTYTSEPLTEDLHLAGEVVVEVWCSADKPSFDLSAVLSLVYPDGQVFNFTQGYMRVNSPQTPLRLTLQYTCAKISKYNALRLSLSAACFPAYLMNCGTGGVLGSDKLMDAQIITVTIKSGGDCSSKVLLPIVPQT